MQETQVVVLPPETVAPEQAVAGQVEILVVQEAGRLLMGMVEMVVEGLQRQEGQGQAARAHLMDLGEVVVHQAVVADLDLGEVEMATVVETVVTAMCLLYLMVNAWIHEISLNPRDRVDLQEDPLALGTPKMMTQVLMTVAALLPLTKRTKKTKSLDEGALKKLIELLSLNGHLLVVLELGLA